MLNKIKYKLNLKLLLISGLGFFMFLVCLSSAESQSIPVIKERVLMKWDFTKGSGNSLNDKSRNKNNGKIHHGEWVETEKGNALSFNGLNTYVKAANSKSLNPEETIRIDLSFCPKKPAKTGTSCLIVKANQYEILLNTAGKITITASLISQENGKKHTVLSDIAGATIFYDQWYHLTLISDHRMLALYLNDKPQSQLPESFNINTGGSALFLGSSDGKTNFFNGLIKDVVISTFVPKEAASITKIDKIIRPPVLTGKLDNPLWKKITPVTDFILLGSDGKKLAKEQTLVYMTYDSDNIYFAFRAEEPEMEKINTKAASFWSRDCIEIFIDTNRDQKTYYHFAVNTVGEKYFAAVLNPNERNELKTVDIKVLIGKGKDYWAAEIAIPFKKLGMGTPEDGTSWGISLNREEKGLRENSGWPSGTFNLPDEFGSLVFNSYSKSIDLTVILRQERITRIKEISSGLDIAGQLKPELETLAIQLKRIKSKNRAKLTRNGWYFLDKDLSTISRNLDPLEIRSSLGIFREKLQKAALSGKKLSARAMKQAELELKELEEKAEKAGMDKKELRKVQQAYWKSLFPDKDYLCWYKSPWDNLLSNQFPPSSVKECKEIKIAMGRNEYESTSFVLTNFSDENMEVDISIKGSRIPVVLREAVCVRTYKGNSVNDALPLLEGNLLVPLGESREVWITVHSKGIKPGDYKVKIKMKPEGLPSHSVDLKIKVYPVVLPDDKPIYTYYWDMIVPAWTKPEIAKALIDNLEAHYWNVGITHPFSVPFPKVDAEGKLKIDYTEHDKTLELYKNAKMISFCWLTDTWYPKKLGKYKFLSDGWKEYFKLWLTDWVKHLKDKGLGYDKYCMNPYDESIRPEVCEIVKLIKETDPRILVYVNHTGETAEEVKNIAPYVDIWCPNLADYLSMGVYARNLDVKQLGNKLLKKNDEFFWTYANPHGVQPQEASPYRYYRLAVWKTWDLGMRGFGYWIYSYKTHWDSYKHKDGRNWAVIYFADAEDAPPGISKKEIVVTSKRWEATREGVEDYVYLYMLREAIKNPAKGVSQEVLNDARKVLTEWPKKVLDDVDNHELADLAKEDILKILSKIR